MTSLKILSYAQTLTGGNLESGFLEKFSLILTSFVAYVSRAFKLPVQAFLVSP